MVLDCETGRFVDGNANALTLFGVDFERLLEIGPAEVSPPVQPGGTPSPEAARKFIGEALEVGSARFEWMHASTAGRLIHCEVRLVRFPVEGRQLVCGTITDISHHKAAEEALSRRERRFRRLIEQGWDVIAQLDASLHLTDVSSPATRLYGADPTKILGRSVLRVVHGADRESARSHLEQVRSTPSSSVRFTVRLTDAKLRIRWIEVVATNLLDDPDVAAIVANCRDVTDRHMAETELQTSRARLELALQGGGVGIWDWWVESGDVTWSVGTAEIFGLAPDEFGGTVDHYRALIHPEDVDSVSRDIDAALASGEDYATEHRVLRPDGEERWIEAKGIVLNNAEGQPERMIGAVRDVTEQRNAEERLQAAEVLYRTLFEELPDPAVVLDAESLVPIRLNARALELLGKDRQRLLSEPLDEQLAPASRPVFTTACRSRERFPSGSWMLDVDQESGDRRQVQMSLDRFRLEGRDVLHVVLRDVTELRRAEAELRVREEQLWHAQRMDAIGRLASGVAHDFNNLLTIISGYAEIARQSTPTDGPAREALDVVLEATRDAESVARSLLTFSRLRGGEASPVDLAEVVDRTGRLLRRTLPASIQLEVDLPASQDARVLGNADQLGQVLMNLAINARDAMPDGGTLRFALETDREQVLLRVSDDGPGIPPELRDRIFEPYFTTKPRGKGTGLGLSILHGIVSGHGGKVEVSSQPGRGATFTVGLPRIAALEQPSDAEGSANPAPRQLHGRVLLAEDNPRLSALVQRALRASGLEVEVVAAGDEALTKVLAAPERFDALILDHDLPGMLGADCLDQLRRAGHRTPVLILTGAPEYELDGRVEAARLLRKPFESGELLLVVADLLGQSG